MVSNSLPTARLAFAVLTMAWLGGAVVTSAQMELGSIQGTVKDEQGQPIEGVTITLKDIGRGREVEAKTDKKGTFFRRGLQAVDYEFTVHKEGYTPIKDQLKVSAGLEKRFDFKLVKAAPEGAGDFANGVKAYNAGDFQTAAQAFEAAVQKAPDLAELHVNLALAYFRLTRTADAVAQLEKAASLAPNDPHVQFQLGSAYVDMKDLPKATAALEQGLAKTTDPKDPLVYDAHVTLGAVLFASGNNDKAQQQFEQALAQKPDDAAALLGIGKVYFSKGDVKQALASFERLTTAHPGTPEATEAASFIAELKK